MSYTVLAALAVLAALVVDLGVARTRLVTTARWWITYAICAVGQLATNGWLTGRRIVTYDAHAILGSNQQRLVGDWRLIYAPVEDIGFGFALLLVTLVVWTLRTGQARRRSARR